MSLNIQRKDSKYKNFEINDYKVLPKEEYAFREFSDLDMTSDVISYDELENLNECYSNNDCSYIDSYSFSLDIEIKFIKKDKI